MKRTNILASLAALAFAVIGSLTFAPAAQAAVIIVTLPAQNGVICHQHTNGDYPEDGHFYDCATATYSNYGPWALGKFQAILSPGTRYTDVPVVLKIAPKASLFVFDDAIAATAWFSAPGVCCSTTVEKTDAYNTYADSTGSTFDPVTGPPAVSCDSRVWAKVGTANGYPAETLQGSSVFTGSASHELGHCFDALAAFPSGLAGMTSKMVKDKAYMMAHDANYAADYARDNRWLTDNSELFAEEFATFENGNTTLVDQDIANYWQCSTFYTKYWMINKASPAPIDFTNNGLSRCN